jgi:hypothetical protein
VYHLVLCAHGRAGMAGPTRQYGHGGCVLVRAGISTAMSYDTRRRRSTQQEHVAVHVHAPMSPITLPLYSADIDGATGPKWRRAGAFTRA